MRTENFQNLKIPKIGFGTWKLSGRENFDPALEKASRAALESALQVGYTHFDTAEYYAAGHVEELLGEAIRAGAVPRQNLFITSKIWPDHLTFNGVLRSCEKSLERLGMDYLDLYLIHWPSPAMDLAQVFKALNLLVRSGQVRNLGVSNFDLPLLKESVALSETPLLTNQVPYSLANREYVQNRVLGYCQENNILLTAYRPLRDINMGAASNLQKIAASHRASPHQVALAWLVNQPGVITIPMSFDRKHQQENLAAADLLLSPAEMEALS